jgi:hypothetical protein
VRFFFFGTLMDAEVLRLVLGPAAPPSALGPAVLTGFRRLGVAGRDYPMLVPHPCGQVEGVLAHGVSAEVAHRLSVYEGDEYDVTPLIVRDRHGRSWEAMAYLTGPKVRADWRRWSLVTWQRRHRRVFLRQVAGLMGAYATRWALAQTNTPSTTSGEGVLFRRQG